MSSRNVTILAEYLRASGMSRADLARAAGLRLSVLDAIADGAVLPGPAVALRVSQVTGGAVSVNDLTLQPGPSPLARALSSEESVDTIRLTSVLEAVLRAQDFAIETPVLEQVCALGADAVDHTCDALAAVSNRPFSDRLLLALKPVLAEMMKEMSLPSLSSGPLAALAELCQREYLQ